ncbi:MAG: GTP pyrophosphokinase [Ghiorsea sp.]
MKHSLGRAIALASKVHANQTDKAGKAYILHPMRVMNSLQTNDVELMSIAILHDVVEDSEITLDDLGEMGFSFRVVQGVACMTKQECEPYEDFIKRAGANPDSRLVKLEDLRDNSDITRLKGIGKRDIERMEKYHRAFLFLKSI